MLRGARDQPGRRPHESDRGTYRSGTEERGLGQPAAGGAGDPQGSGDAGTTVAHDATSIGAGMLDHSVGERSKRGTVSHDHGGAAADQPAHGRQHLALRPAVQAGRGLVEQEQRCVPHEGAGQRHALALAGREPRSSLAQQRLGTVRQAPHDLGQAGGLERGGHLGV